MSYAPREEGLAGWVRLQMAARFDPEDVIAERAREIYELEEKDEPALAAILREAADADARERATWPEVTDCDRLDRAFDALDAEGVLARQNFSCCQRCGSGEMFDLVHDEREMGRALDGYVFYHAQDTDSVVAGGSLHLRYAGMGDGPGDTAAIGRRVVEALRAEGLEASWDGRPDRTIELPSFAWKRRAPPARPAPVWSAESCIEDWCRELPRLFAAFVAQALGRGYGGVVARMGDVDVALAWARSHPPRSAQGMARSSALLEVAHGLREALAEPAQVVALLVEACAAAPWGRHGALIDLLVGADLTDPVFRDAVRARVLSTRRDPYGTAAVAWYLVRAPGENEAGDLLAAVDGPLDEPDPYRAQESARVALAAAIWVLRTRRGDAAGAETARAHLASVKLMPYVTEDFAVRALVAAAAEVGRLATLAAELAENRAELVPEIVNALAGAGEIDAADRLAGESGLASLARLALRAPGDPRATDWIARATDAFTLLDEHIADALVSDGEARDARLAFARLQASLGQPALARPAVASVVETARADFATAGRSLRAYLQEVRDGSRAPVLPTDESWLLPQGEQRIAASLKKWQAATDRSRQMRARRDCGNLLLAAAALGRSGRRPEAKKLLEQVLAVADLATIAGWNSGPLVVAFAANGMLDRALEQARDPSSQLGSAAEAALSAALVEAGRAPEALQRLGPALELGRADQDPTAWESWLPLGPAVLLVAPDPRAAAGAMLEAWRHAEAGLSALFVT
jgi:hypothetical protein